MKKFFGTILSAGTGATSAYAASQTGDMILTVTMVVINAAILLTNAGIEIYRKIRDRDKDLTKKRSDDDEKNV